MPYLIRTYGPRLQDDFDVFMPGRWEKDRQRRRAAGIPGSLRHKAKPELARRQLGRLLDAGMPAAWAAFDEVYTRSGKLRQECGKRRLPYVGIAPRDFRVTLPSGNLIKAEDAVKDAVSERRSCGNGSKEPRYSELREPLTRVGRPDIATALRTRSSRHHIAALGSASMITSPMYD